MDIADTAATHVRARIDTNPTEGAADALGAKVPNATTRQAVTELEAGKGKCFNTIDDLMADLHAED